VTTVHVIYTADARGSWTARLAEEPRCQAWGPKTLDPAGPIREAAAQWLDELGVTSVDELTFEWL
jgi:hypothetical protein